MGLVKKELTQYPTFKGTNLFDLADLCFGLIDPNNPNLFTLGNNNFSIKIWCEGGKIYAHQRKSMLEIRPGK